MRHGLSPALRAKWDALIATEGNRLGISGCRAFLENKLVNDVFYEGQFNGRPCMVKCSSRAPESILNEYEMSRRLASVDPGVCAEPLAHWRSPDGKMSFAVMQRLPGPSLTELIARGIEMDEAIGIMEDMVRIAEALQKAGIVWRDIIPDNFLMGSDGHLKLIDAQFAIDRNAFREDPYLASHWKYRTLLFAHHPDMAGRGWNDVAMMLHFTRGLKGNVRIEQMRDRLKGMLEAAAFPMKYGMADDVKMVLCLADLCLRRLFAHRPRKALALKERSARAVRFLARRAKW